MKHLKNIKDFSINENMQIVKFTKQTMKLKNINWKAAKNFDVYYNYVWLRGKLNNNDENGYNVPNGVNYYLADTTKLRYLSKRDVDEILEYASEFGGNPRPAFTIKKGTSLFVIEEEFCIIIRILDGDFVGEEFKAQLVDFRTCLVGESSDEKLNYSKYRIFLNGEPFKAKYYTDMGKIKLALRVAFDITPEEAPYYIIGEKIDKYNIKNVQIMRYDNNSKIPIPVDFNVKDFYDDIMIKKDAKKYNL